MLRQEKNLTNLDHLDIDDPEALMKSWGQTGTNYDLGGRFALFFSEADSKGLGTISTLAPSTA